MAFFLRGALVEYGSDVLGPIPNIVVFQFNPENISRTLNIARTGTDTPENNRQTESSQTSAPPVESFSITAHFSAADDLGKVAPASAVARTFGVGPQLAALERMVYTETGIISGAAAAAVDNVGSTLNPPRNTKPPTRPTPREDLARILFVWGSSRILPVEIKSMTINEKKYDPFLNPVEAEVQVGLQIASFPTDSDDKIGKGALDFTQKMKNAQTALNLEKSLELAIDIIPF